MINKRKGVKVTKQVYLLDVFSPNGVRGRTEEAIKFAANFKSDACLIWPYAKSQSGYGRGWLDGRRVTAHRAVLSLASGVDYDDQRDACHNPTTCNNPSCVNPAHLRWADKSENMFDKAKAGTNPTGERSNNAKLKDEDAVSIRAAYERGAKVTALSGQYRVHENSIYNILNRKTFAHV